MLMIFGSSCSTVDFEPGPSPQQIVASILLDFISSELLYDSL
jgi:hypothetical protein